MKKVPHSLKALSAGVTCALASLSVNAHEIQSFNLDQSIQDSGLVFEGKVIAVENRVSSTPSDEYARLPHTFVTYSVDNILKGSYDDQTITLRFIGGQDPETGDYLTVEGVPSFNMDEHDILFVGNQNGESICPLLGCEKGRFRVVGDNIYSQHGEQIHLSEQGTVKFGALAPAKDLKRIWTHELPAELVEQMSAEERDMMLKNELPLPDMTEEQDTKTGEDGETITSKLLQFKQRLTDTFDSVDSDAHALGARLNPADLTDRIKQQDARLRLNNGLVAKQLEPVKNLDVEQNFYIPMPKEVAPADSQVIKTPVIQSTLPALKLKPAFSLGSSLDADVDTRTPAEIEEEEMIRSQGGNPVLK